LFPAFPKHHEDGKDSNQPTFAQKSNPFPKFGNGGEEVIEIKKNRLVPPGNEGY
jgi:hypothetical protein